MKSQKFLGFAAMVMAMACAIVSGCGGGSNANTITVAVSPPNVILVTTQTQTFSATVSGATTTTVTWTCTFTTTTSTTAADGTVTSTTSSASPCTDKTGNIPASSTDTTVIYTAPTTFPNDLTGLVITLTATSTQDTKKTGTATINLDSGVRINVTPPSASVPTKESQQFVAGQTNDSKPDDVSWLVTQQASTSTTPLPQAASCSPGCGTIDASGNYTAPSSVPTTSALTVVATSKLDTARFGTATVTIAQGGPIAFKSISPTAVALGGIFEDISLEATNVSSKSGFNVMRPDGTVVGVPPTQVKVLIPEPSTTTPNPTSSGAKIRLSPTQLNQVGVYKVSITDPVEPVTGGPFSFQVISVQPALTSSTPQSVSEGTLPGTQAFTVNGGYFGGGGNPPVAPFVSLSYQGNSLAIDQTHSNARHLAATFTGENSGPPGLYPITVVNNNTVAPTPRSAVTNISVFPDFEGANPASFVGGTIATGATPSGMAVDSELGVAIVTNAAANTAQFYSIGAGSLTPLGSAVPVGTLPTDVTVDELRHRAIVVNFGSKSLTVLQIPTPPAAPSTTPLATINLSGLIPATASTNSTAPPPSPFSVGVDPDTNLALVAFGSTNVGFIINLFLPGVDSGAATSPNTCFVTSSVQHLPCAAASVTLPTGKFPQIAMEPHVHLAFVTPGAVGVGAGPLSVIDLTQPNGKTQIASAARSSNVVTVTTAAAHNLNPGNPGVVLINGLPNGPKGTIFNGTYAVASVVDSLHFQFLETAPDDTVSGNSSSFAFYGAQSLSFTVSSSLQGVAINPITRTAAMADPNADGVTGAQIELINSLDQSVSSIDLHAECIVGSTTCSAPEIGATNVAFQPYSNVLVAFNPVRNEVSLINPSSAASVRGRYFIGLTGQQATNSITAADGTVLTISGAVVVDPDPAHNQAFLVSSKSNNIRILSLGTVKATHIRELSLTAGQIPGTRLRQATLTSATALTGVRILGTGFDSASQVRLDGTSVAGAGGTVTFVSSTELDVTIPASFLAVPRRFALDVINSSGVQSNATDFSVLQAIDVSKNCSATKKPQPGAVAIDNVRDLALVANTGCNTVSVIDINPVVGGATNPNFGKVLSTVSVGAAPTGIAVSPRMGIAAVTNNTAGTVSIIDVRNPAAAKEIVPDVTVGTQPTGIAIDSDNGAMVVANTGSNTVSVINLNALFTSPAATSLTALTIATDQQPLAVAIDPERGTNSNGLAAVTTASVSSSASGTTTIGSVDLIDLGATTPAKTSSITINSLSASPTGIVFDPTLSPALFYVASSLGNAISSLNPDTGSQGSTAVGINPTSLAFNPETGTILTVNTLSNTISFVDTLTSPFKTQETIGLSGSPQFSAAIHPRTNLAVLTDQANNRVLLVPMLN